MPETAPRPDVPDELIDAWLTVRVGPVNDNTRKAIREHLVPVLPAHERQVRERVAAEIEAERSGGTEHWETAMDHAARIARGES